MDKSFVSRLQTLLEEAYGRRLPKDYAMLLEVLANPGQLVRKDKNGPVTVKSDKNFRPERVLEELVDSLSPEEILQLIPDTAAESKAFRSFISNIKMGQDEDTIWRKITGYANVNREWTRAIAARFQGQKALEIMAGNGLLARLLLDAGLSVIPTDISPDKSNDYISMRGGNFTDVMAMDALSAIRRFGKNTDLLICSWPPHGEEQVMKALEAFTKLNPKGCMLYIGEWKGGYNATNAFFDAVEVIDPLDDINSKHVSLPGSKDGIRLLQLKS